MIYLDNSATTAMYRELLADIEKYAVDNYYNPSGLYSKAMDITRDINVARGEICDILGANNYELTFTASGSESDNTIIFGARLPRNSRIIISNIEHSAVYNPAMKLVEKGYDVVLVKCDRFGKVDIDDFNAKMTPNTSLVSIMHVCNETGAVNDIRELVKISREVNKNVIFHSDGVQAVGKIPVKLASLGVDAYSFSAHKFHGMKGIGGLFLKKGLSIAPLVYGGGQEKGLRSATENVAGIITTARALKRVYSEKNADIPSIRQRILDGILDIDPKTIVNTDMDNSAPYILSCALPNTRGEVLLHSLEDKGIIIGTGSACSSHKGNNRIATALNIPKDYNMGMIRLSLSNATTMSEAEEFLAKFREVYNDYRAFVK